MYKYYFDDDKKRVYCISTYAGKIVKGVAKCAPQDRYVVGTGAKIAKARCDAKVSEKRVKNANNKYYEAQKEYLRVKCRLEKMAIYVNDAIHELEHNRRELQELIENV